MKLIFQLIFALALAFTFSACSSSGGTAKKTKPAASSSEDDEETPLENSGSGSRVCGWSDTGRWECTGPKPDKVGETKEKKTEKPKRGSSKKAEPEKTKSDIVTDPISDDDLN